MKKYFAVLVCVIISSSFVKAQWNEWVDSGLVVRLNADGIALSYLLSFQKQNGGIYACGLISNDSNEFHHVVKFNDQLQIISSKSYQGNIQVANSNSYYSLIPKFFLSDGSVVFSGVFYNFDTIPYSIYEVPVIMLMNPDNTVAWTKSVNAECGWNGDAISVSVIQNEILISSYFNCYANSGTVLTCFDLDGNLQWSKKIGANNPGGAVKILPLSTSDFLYVTSFGYVFDISLNGIIHWGKKYADFYFSNAIYDSFNQIDLLVGLGILKIDTAGNVSWFKNPVSPLKGEWYAGLTLAQAPDGGYYVLGAHNYDNGYSGDSYPLYFKYETDGTLKWIKEGNDYDFHHFATVSGTQNIMWGHDEIERGGLDFTKSCYQLTDIVPWEVNDLVVETVPDNFSENYGITLNNLQLPEMLVHDVNASQDTICNVVDIVLTGISTPPIIDLPVTVFPNPVLDEAQLNTGLKTGEHFQVAIVDVFGKILQEENFTAGKSPPTISFHNFPSGIYLLQLHHADKVQTVKIYKD